MYDLWNRWNGQVVDNRNWGQPSSGPRQAGKKGGGSIALHCGRKASLSCEQDRDEPIRMVLRRLAAQVCMGVM
jgi:hypothetical protein